MKDVNWPFDQPKNCAVITLKQIIEKEIDITFVSHDADDHGWQFLGDIELSEEDARIICLSEAVELDNSILELAKIPPGYYATRKSKKNSWIIKEEKTE